jgi:histone H3/H4
MNKRDRQQFEREHTGDIDDSARVKKVLLELGAKAGKATGKPYTADASVSSLLVSYASELTGAILEEASLLAQHRSAEAIDVEDICLILGKKFGVEVPGFHSSSLLHKHTLKSFTGDRHQDDSMGNRDERQSSRRPVSKRKSLGEPSSSSDSKKGSDKGGSDSKDPSAVSSTNPSMGAPADALGEKVGSEEKPHAEKSGSSDAAVSDKQPASDSQVTS